MASSLPVIAQICTYISLGFGVGAITYSIYLVIKEIDKWKEKK